MISGTTLKFTAKQCVVDIGRSVTQACAALVAVATLAICAKGAAWLAAAPNDRFIALFSSAAICTILGLGLALAAWLMDQAQSVGRTAKSN